jgi:phosphoribosylformylglycinamidine synthase
VHGTKKALAITTDVSPRYCQADPLEGAKQAVAEAWRNLTAVGARPLAVTDNLNYGNPQKPEIMWQIVAGIDGIGQACRALDFPIVSGNCSLYNETNGEGILPTPCIGAVGLIGDVTRMASLAFKRAGDALLLIGETPIDEGGGHLGQSVYLREIEGREEGGAPPVNLAMEKKNGDFVRALIEAGRIDTAHDVSDGGLVTAAAEMALAGNIGVTLKLDSISFAFGEDQARYLIAAPAAEAEAIVAEAMAAGVRAVLIGHAGGAAIALEHGASLALSALRAAHEGWLPGYMNAPHTN